MDGITNIVTYFTGSGDIKGKKKQGDSLGRLNSMGVEGLDTAEAIAKQMTGLVPMEPDPSKTEEDNFHNYSQNIWGHLKNVMNKVINLLPVHRIRRIQRQRAAAVARPAIDTRFDASRPSPLSRFRKPV
jgi:hypothetical protein